jgi:hypothetical protein
VTRVEGCLATPDQAENAATRFPVTRSAGPEVTVEPTPGGVVIVHRLEHACCLSVRAELERTGDAVELLEELGGTPCRCRCSSTLRTAIELEPGRYTARVRVQENDHVRDAFNETVMVSASAPPKPRLPRTIHVPERSQAP